VVGRWSLTAPLFADAPATGPRLRAQAELMLERHGIVTRETVLAEGVPGGFATLYGELTNLELLGTTRRGYFVEGLGGAQFALPGAVERLRGLPRAEGDYTVLAATDPANPYGGTLPWPKLENQRRPSRAPGAYVLLRDGEPLLYVERGGRGVLRLAPLEGAELEAALAELSAAARDGVIAKLGIERLDGDAVIGSAHEATVIAAGFSRQPRRLVARAR
jgi:ATP-dependent Lhr-like helicase